MSARYTFNLESRDGRHPLPHRINLGQNDTETTAHVILKLMAYLLFCRERLQIEASLHLDDVPFIPDLVQLDYTLRPVFWVECGECGVNKLRKLAVKLHECEIWVVKRSLADAGHLLRAMGKEELRRGRYQLLALDPEMFDEMNGLLLPRNNVVWYQGTFAPGHLQMEFNGLWFDAPFEVLKY
ncbi:MAG TPA: YaeQ family protein [Verrucomicrobiae bacterium]|nr:YaeQ family protein [Verrucomicrobiae bacterium]